LANALIADSAVLNLSFGWLVDLVEIMDVLVGGVDLMECSEINVIFNPWLCPKQGILMWARRGRIRKGLF
jgi:hypothetical protein